MKKIIPFFLILRPRQWIKNFFVFAPLIFSGMFLNQEAVIKSFCAFIFFCIASSLIYVINDVYDIDNDRAHPIKKERPLAKGTLKINEAFFLSFTLFLILLISFFINFKFSLILFTYIFLNILYSYKLKHEPILDIFSIAMSFVLRVIAGSYILDLPISSWMCITTLSLALYLASIKRRQELLNVGSHSREVLGNYGIELVDRYAEISATSALMFYSLFVLSSKPNLVITIPFVIFGLFRYWYIVQFKNKGEAPTDVLLNDWQIIFTILLWLSLTLFLVGFNRL
jgi:decaprenyl-phosphate phosphoribosyltransferase